MTTQWTDSSGKSARTSRTSPTYSVKSLSSMNGSLLMAHPLPMLVVVAIAAQQNHVVGFQPKVRVSSPRLDVVHVEIIA